MFSKDIADISGFGAISAQTFCVYPGENRFPLFRIML